MGGIEYSGANLEAIYHVEGRCTPNGATAFFYEYTVKDHLGNARVNFRANGTAVTFLEELHYYPFGMTMEGIGTAATTQNKYRYNGKEMNDDFGLNWSDYRARWYDAALGRWWSVDPKGEKYLDFSTYCYGGNNPILIIDPNGMELYIKINENYGTAISDILGLINNAKFRGRVSINFTTPIGEKSEVVKAEVSFIGLRQSTINKDAGLKLLDDLSKSDKKYLYEVASKAGGENRETGEDTRDYKLGSASNVAKMALNLSVTDRSDKPKSDNPIAIETFGIFNSKPKNGFDGHVIVSPDTSPMKYESEGGKTRNLPRSLIAFHELQESYKRTDEKLPYSAAHQSALDAEKSFYATPAAYLKSGIKEEYDAKKLKGNK